MGNDGPPGNAARIITGILLAAAVVTVLTYFGLQPGKKRNVATTPTATGGTSTGGTTTQSPGLTPKLAAPVYVDSLPQTGGDTGSGDITPGLVVVNGRKHAHGLQFAINGARTASYAIPQYAQTFSATIANDDNQSDSGYARVTLVYEVFVDGQRKAIGHVLGHVHDPPLTADVSGKSTLQLVVGCGTTCGDGSPQADWANPVFR